MDTCEAFGVDLGTTNSAAGIIKNGKVEITIDSGGQRIVPSYVQYPPKGNPAYIVGTHARKALERNAVGVIYDCKRLIGVKYDSEVVKRMEQYVSFDIVNDGKNRPQVSVMQNGEEVRKTPEEIGALILAQMQENASRLLGRDLKNVVITVPAYFNQKQRQATKNAGEIAGLNVLEIISEPVAAAYAYADQNNIGQDGKEKTIMIYDLGGGTFDVTIMSVKGSHYEELALDGDLFLGGSDFDCVIMKDVIREFEADGDSLTKRQRGKLRYSCEEAKKCLTSVESTDICLDDYEMTLTKSKMNYLLRPYIQKTIDICDRAIKSCGKTVNDIDDIILVGGSCRLRLVHEMLEQHFNKELKESINPDECVAYGATKYAYSIMHGLINGPPTPTTTPSTTPSTTSSSPVQPQPQPQPQPSPSPSPSPFVIPGPPHPLKPVNVATTCPSNIGIDAGGRMHVMIKKGTRLPCEASVSFSNGTDYAHDIPISIYQGNDILTANNTCLCSLQFPIEKPLPRGKNSFTLFLTMDVKGSLNARIRDNITGKSGSVSNIQEYYSKQQVEAMRARLRQEQERNREHERIANYQNQLAVYATQRLNSTRDIQRRQRLEEILELLSKPQTVSELNRLRGELSTFQ